MVVVVVAQTWCSTAAFAPTRCHNDDNATNAPAGPSTVAGMCAAKGWTSSIVPGLLTSTLGYAIGTFIGMALGRNFLCRL